jgi:hypothetical protein
MKRKIKIFLVTYIKFYKLYTIILHRFTVLRHKRGKDNKLEIRFMARPLNKEIKPQVFKREPHPLVQRKARY